MKVNDYTIPETNITDVFSPLQMFQYYDKYSRFLWDEGRREDWHETIARTTDFLRYLSNEQLPFETYQVLFDLMYLGEIGPSMRLLNMAGRAAKRDNACLYNCSYLVVNSLRAFDEMLSLSMSGCGVGFSVESHHVNKLPEVPYLNEWQGELLHIPDTQGGWQESIKELFHYAFYYSVIPKYDYSSIRPSGSPLLTKGGYSSGPQVLKDVHRLCSDILRSAQGRKLTTVEAFDIMTILPEAGISGGVRRAATIALFDADDKDMLNAKTGNFMEHHPNRVNANISAVWPETVSMEDVEFLTGPLFNTGFGEPGLFKRDVALNSCERRHWTQEDAVGVNPSLRAGTIIPTAKGAFPIEKLEGKCFQIVNLNGNWSEAACFLSGQGKQLVKLSLSNGAEYYCTKEHKWPKYTTNGYTKTLTTDLKIGDKLPQNTTNTINGKLGTHLDGFVAGWLYGDGWLTIRKNDNTKQWGMVVSKKDEENGILDVLQRFLDTLGVNSNFPWRNKKGNIGWYEKNINNRNFNEWVNQFGLDKKQFGLPDSWLSEISEQFAFGFLDGLLSSDGHIEANGSKATLTISYDKLAQDVFQLLGLMGIPCTIRQVKSENNFGNGKTYTTNVITFNPRFLQYVTHDEKRNRIKEKYRNKTVWNTTITNIEYTDLYEDVWDITVYDDTHCFALSNVITGNCGIM